MAVLNAISLANRALARFGGGALQSFDQSLPPGPSVNLVFWSTINGLLAEHPWNFTKLTVPLKKVYGPAGGGEALYFYNSPDYSASGFSLANPPPGAPPAAPPSPPYPFLGGDIPPQAQGSALPPGACLHLPPLFGAPPPTPNLQPPPPPLPLPAVDCEPVAGPVSGYPPTGWRFGYALPPQRFDVVKFLTSPNFADAPVTRYEVQGDTLWCDDPVVWAVARFPVDVPAWPAYFAIAAEWCLAAELIMPISGNAGLLENMQARAWGTPEQDRSGGYLGIAKRRDAIAGGVKVLPPDPLSLARIGGGGSAGYQGSGGV
jgi:hypothetical protein